MKKQNHTSHFTHHTSQKGITLIALIITIIVMLILVGVTINVALNGGLFDKASEASEEMQREAEKEELLSAVVAAIGTDAKVDFNYLDKNLPTDWKGSNGTYKSPKGNIYEVDEYGKITNGGEGNGSGTQPGSLTDFEKYILGPAGTGRALVEFDEDGNQIGGIINLPNFLDDPLTEGVDETETLGVEALTMGQNEDLTKVYIYAKYDNKVYRIIVNPETYSSELPLDVVYEPQGREGQTIEDGWTILYDNGETVEAVSPTAMGSLTLGYSETATDIETRLTEAIESYNNAIITINNYCKNELTGLPTNIGVRSVGASSETSDYYYSDNLAAWNSEYNGVGKKRDILYEQDFVRMVYHGVLSTGTEYLMASRMIFDNSSSVSFCVMTIDKNSFGSGAQLWDVQPISASGYNKSYPVRPIITIQN